MQVCENLKNSEFWILNSEWKAKQKKIRNKIKKAYGPPKEIEFNPLINWVQTLVFWGEEEGELKVERPEKFGGNLSFKTYAELADTFEKKLLHPMDLKTSVVKYLDQLLQPVREHFEKDEEAKKLLEIVKSYSVTR